MFICFRDHRINIHIVGVYKNLSKQLAIVMNVHRFVHFKHSTQTSHLTDNACYAENILRLYLLKLRITAHHFSQV